MRIIKKTTEQRQFPTSAVSSTVTAGGALTITSTYHSVRGPGGAAVTVSSIVMDASMIGKLIVLVAGGAEDITFDKTVIGRGINYVLNETGDALLVKGEAANSIRMVQDTAGV